MHNEAFQQQSGQNQHKSTTVWTQPSTDEQRTYYSKHAAERRVFGWISALLQFGHGILAFAAFSTIYAWVLASVPAVMFIVPFASAGTLMALHILFRTTWQTYWYDKLDDDPKTDSPIAVPIAIIVLLLIVEVQGARMFLQGQVKPPEKQDTEVVEQSYASLVGSIDASLRNDQQHIEQVYSEKAKAASASYDRQIRSLKNRGGENDADRRSIRAKIASLEAQKDNALAPIRTAKADALEKAWATANARKDSEANRRQNAVASIDNSNASEVSRHLSDLGNVNRYAWMLSVCLLGIIAALLYRMVRINVKSGILPLRNYTILDAHGSVAERIWTAISDAFNRRGLQFAVWLHRLLSPNEAITSFDGTVVANPGTYNTPEGFFPESHAPEDDAALKSKVFQKVMTEASKGGVLVTPEMLENELAKARKMNGSYLSSPLSGKTEPSASTARAEGIPYPAGEVSYDQKLREWASLFSRLIEVYDHELAANRRLQADEQLAYINSTDGPIKKGAKHLGIEYGIDKGDDEVVVWKPENPAHKVPLSMLSEAALNALSSPAPGSLDEIRFKSNLNQFEDVVKPNCDDFGNVIGVKYRKDNGTWGLIGEAQIASRLRIQQKYAAAHNASPKVMETLGKWQYAMQLMEQGKVAKSRNMETVLI